MRSAMTLSVRSRRQRTTEIQIQRMCALSVPATGIEGRGDCSGGEAPPLAIWPMCSGEIQLVSMMAIVMHLLVVNNQASGSGRARRDAAARAMQGWQSQRLLGNGEVGDPIIKDKSPIPLKSREKQLKNIGGQK